MRCTSCGDELLVAFSCKSRGVCPSCNTRRMQGTATHLIDRVLPHVPMRQCVLSLPRWARFLLARDPALITRTLDLALRAIFACHRLRARRLGVHAARTGSVSFVPLPGPADDDVQRVLRKIERRVRALLKPPLEAAKADARPPDALTACQAESVSALRGKPPDAAQPKRLAAYHQGFSLHAGVHYALAVLMRGRYRSRGRWAVKSMTDCA